MEQRQDLDSLHKDYSASAEAREVLRESGLVVVGNEVAGSGKDFIIKQIVDFPGSSYGFVPSRKTRDPREGEVLGVDFVHSPLDQAVKEVQAGRYIEWQPLRGTEINGTHIEELEQAIKDGVKPVKDVEPLGQAALRELNPDLRAIYPLPDLSWWLNSLKRRERLPGTSLRAFVEGDINPSEFGTGYPAKREDIIKRLRAAAAQQEQIEELNLHRQPGTLFIVNEYGRVGEVARLCYTFLEEGCDDVHVVSELCLAGDEVVNYLGEVRALAEEVLRAA